MNQLDINAKPETNPDGLDFVKEGTRFNILENKVALAVPEGNPAGVESYDDLAAKLGGGKVVLAICIPKEALLLLKDKSSEVKR